MARMNDYSWGASSSSKKRSLSPALPLASAKRPKQRPFIDISSSEDESGSEKGVSYSNKGHIAMASEQTAKTSIGRNNLLFDTSNDTSSVETDLQRHGTDRTLENSARRSTPSTSLPLNKGRLKVLMAKKQGGSVAQSSRVGSSPKTSAYPDLRNRPLNATQIRNDDHSSAPRVKLLSSQREGNPPGQSERRLQAHRGRTNDLGSSHTTSSQAHTQRTPFLASGSTTLQKAQSARLHSASNISSLRNTLDTAKAGHRSIAQEAGNIGSDSKRAQTERPTKPTQRPEAGARYGHTLTARKSHTQEKENGSSKCPSVTTGVGLYHNLGLKDCAPSSGASLASERTQSSGSIALSALEITPSSNRTSAFDARQRLLNPMQTTTKRSAHQGLLPEISSNRTQVLPYSSTGKELIDKREERLTQSAHTTTANHLGFNESNSSQQGAIEVSDPTSTDSDQFHRATSAEGLGSKEIPAMATAARCKRLEELTDTRVQKIAPDKVEAMEVAFTEPATHGIGLNEPPAASIESGAQLKTPTAVMTCLARRIGPDKSIPPGAHIPAKDVSRDASPSGTIGRLQFSSGGEIAETGADPSLVLHRGGEPEPMDLGPERAPAYDAVSKLAFVGSTALTDTASSTPIEVSYRRQNSCTSPAFEKTQPVMSPSKSQSPAPGADTENAQSQPVATTIPLSASVPNHIAALEKSVDTREAPKDSSVAKAATNQSPTSSAATEITFSPSAISPTAEPFFEYSIYQSIAIPPSSTKTTELSAQPFTTLDSANTQTDKLLESAKQQYELLGMKCNSATIKTLDTSLSIHEARFTSIEDPSKTLALKLWIQRAEVGIYANQTPSPSTLTSPLISKTLYALRLWRLVEETTDSESEVEDEDEDENAPSNHEKLNKAQIRIYHALPSICTELHTSLESGNRAAKRVQIELSHEKAPKSMQAKWQTENLRALNKKLEDLKSEMDGTSENSETPSLFEYGEGRRKGCWRSVFDGYGLGGNRFELLVTSVRVSGPRNL